MRIPRNNQKCKAEESTESLYIPPLTSFRWSQPSWSNLLTRTQMVLHWSLLLLKAKHIQVLTDPKTKISPTDILDKGPSQKLAM